MVDEVNEQLLSAISDGNLKIVKFLLSEDFDVNVRFGRKSDTLLHIAANVEIVNELLSRGADVNATNLSGETPLFRAIVDDKGLLVVRALLSAKADVNRKYYGITLLHFPKDADITKEVLLHGLDVNSRDWEGRTPLHNAVCTPGALETVKLLLKHGAEVDAVNYYGKTPLYGIMCAIVARKYRRRTYYQFNNDLTVVKELLEYGADINPDEVDSSPLFIAFCCENLQVIQVLIRTWMFLHFDEDYLNKILEPFIGKPVYFKVKSCIEECVSELKKLKCDYIYNNNSLYDFISFKKSQTIRPLYFGDRILERSNHYPIYHDIVYSRLKLCSEKADLLVKLRELQIYSVKENFEEVVLIPDCIIKIGEYLSNEDLMNFFTAFSENFL